MSTLSRKRIRLLADQATRAGTYMTDVYTGATPELWRGNDVQFEVGIGHAAAIVDDISNIASLTLEVFDDGRSGAPLMTKTLAAASLSTITDAAWDAGTDQNALFTFTGTETNLDLESALERSLWLVVSMETTDSPGHNVTLQATVLKLVEDATGNQGDPPDNADQYFTKGEADARYQQQHADGASFYLKNGQHPYIHNGDDGLWYPIVCQTVDGVAVLALGPGESL